MLVAETLVVEEVEGSRRPLSAMVGVPPLGAVIYRSKRPPEPVAIEVVEEKMPVVVRASLVKAAEIIL